MTLTPIDEKYYINVARIMNLKTPRCRLQKPTLKPTILVTGWNEWLQIKGVDTGI